MQINIWILILLDGGKMHSVCIIYEANAESLTEVHTVETSPEQAQKTKRDKDW